MIKNHVDMKGMFLFMAERLSGNFSSVGFFPIEESIFLDNSRPDILEKILHIFSNIGFLGNKALICDIPISEAKYYLNLVAAYISGRYGIVGPLSFILKETDACLVHTRRGVKIIEVRNGAVSVDALSLFFTELLEEERKTNAYLDQLIETKVFAQEA